MAAFDDDDEQDAKKKAGARGQSAFNDAVIDDQDPPSAKFINWLLANADSRAARSLLHPIGFGDGDAAAGSHKHDGKDSPFLFNSTPVVAKLPASPTSAQIVTAVNAIIDHLNSRGVGQ